MVCVNHKSDKVCGQAQFPVSLRRQEAVSHDREVAEREEDKEGCGEDVDDAQQTEPGERG